MALACSQGHLAVVVKSRVTPKWVALEGTMDDSTCPIPGLILTPTSSQLDPKSGGFQSLKASQTCGLLAQTWVHQESYFPGMEVINHLPYANLEETPCAERLQHQQALQTHGDFSLAQQKPPASGFASEKHPILSS